MIGWIASSNAEASDRSESVTATLIAPIHHTPTAANGTHLDVELERVRAPADLAFVLGDRSGVGAVGVAAARGRCLSVALVRPLGPRPGGLGVRHDRSREHLGLGDGQRHVGVVRLDEFERNGRRMGLGLDGHRPPSAPLPLEQVVPVDLESIADRADVAQSRQLDGRRDAEHLAQVQGEQHRATRILTDHPRRRAPG